MSKPLYSGQDYLNKSEALGLKIYKDNHGQCTKVVTLVQSKVFLRKLGQARMYTAMSGCTKKNLTTQKVVLYVHKKNVHPLIPYVIKEYNLRTTLFTQKITRDSCMYTYIHFKNNHA